ncbi:hypothetical protein [Streptomyces sp. NPDC058665]|uniref:hypothetical protein n=1 Tax=Streptomyces sp. NPDC058665 TaxID=3346586 RepID=UPI00365A5446
MTVGASGGYRRAGWWAPACLLTVLAAVVHIFVCAHGPQSSGAGGADSLSAVRPVAVPALVVAQGGRAAVDTDRAADGSVFAHCPGADQPGWVQQDSQLKPPAMAVRAETVLLPTGVSGAGSRAGAARGRRAPPDDGRAGLGVWRI